MTNPSISDSRILVTPFHHLRSGRLLTTVTWPQLVLVPWFPL